MKNLAFLGTLAVLAATLFVQACTTKDVVGVDIGSVTVLPPSATLQEGETQQFTAVVRDADGVVIEGAEITWSSDRPDTVSIDQNGLATGLLRGTAQIRATFQGVSGEATVTVLQTAGFTVSPASGPTTESGGEATFTVVLDSEPDADVTIGLSSSDTGEGVVLAPVSGQLTFTNANWNTPQTVTVKGQNDALADGNVVYTIITDPAVSADAAYNGIDPADVSFTNNDDDAATISVSAASGPTTERGGTATFTVVLNSLPSADVSIALSSSNPAEGTVSPSQVTFTTLNWNAPQTVTVTGQDDAAPDGNVAYTIITDPATSADATYDGVDPPDVSVTNVDDETAGITVSPISRATTEAGGQATFTVTLNAAPTADVTIGLSSSDPTEGTSSASSLTFTASNWFVAQTVTVTGQDDDIDDGDIVYSIVTAPATSSDGNYDAFDADDVSVTNVDDETAGFVVSPPSGPTTEAGGTATFTVALASQPAADVTIGLTSSNTAEGMVAPASLTFTPTGWSVAQTVTVTGVNDAIADGNVVYTIFTAPATSADPLYSGRDAPDVSITNVDDETVGIVVSAVSGPTSEAGGTATFTVVLSTAPSADVTIALSSSNVGEGTVSPDTLTFTAAPGLNAWDALHTVTVTGQDDLVDDGDVTYTIVTAPASSADGNYDTLDPADVNVTNVDDDAAGITVSPISGPTTEAGGSGLFSVVLNSQPTADVVIALASSDTSEGTVAPTALTFTPSGPTAWNVPQPVTVTGQDDAEADGNIAYTILTAPATSADLRYNGVDAADVSVTNIDNETAGITVTPISGPTTEAGGTATFTVSLSSQPSANVTIGLSSSDATEGTVSAPSLTFTPSGAGAWNVPQTVTVTGVDDLVDDGNVVYTIVTAAASSSDATYGGLDPADVSVTNNDDDTAGVTVSPTGLVTTEAGGAGQFSVVLNSQPTANVTVTLLSTDPTEGLPSPTSLTFAPTGPTAWNVAQTVTVTGQDDLTADGNIAYAIVTNPVTSTDPRYGGLNPADVSVTNVDDETPGITVSPISGPTTEAGGSATFTVVLSTQPTADVSIELSSSNTNEGTISPTSLTFTPSGPNPWDVPQVVTVTGVDDFIDDGNVAYSIVTATATSSDAAYGGTNPADVAVTNNDDDTAGVTVSPTGLLTTEAGGAAQFTVVLNSQPTADVTITLASTDPTEGVASPTSLTFTPGGGTAWNIARAVTVTGQDDVMADGNVPYLIVTDPVTSADPRYNALNPADVSVTNVDNETAGITVTPISGPTTEAGGSATFTVALSTQPSADVSIALSSSNPSEGTVSPSLLTFTPSGPGGVWNVPQLVTVTGVDDEIDDGNVMYTILTGAATSSDPTYDGFDPADVSVTNVDNDAAGISVSAISGPTTEGGGAATFTVALTSRPTANVTIDVSSNDTSEGVVTTPATGSLTFTDESWDTPQTVTVTGQDDDVDDDNVMYLVVTDPATSTDPSYSGRNAADVSVTNVDDDGASVSVSPISGPTSEAGGTATFTVVLDSQPTASVTISLSSADASEGIAAPATLTFQPSGSDAWDVAQTVTVTGQDDAIDDDNVAYSITTTATSADPKYNGINVADVPVTNLDDADTAGVSVTPTSGLVTTETGGAAQFTVVLTSEPVANVTIGLASSDPGEGTPSTASITFTASGASAWNLPRTVTVTGVNDDVDDDDQAYTIVTTASSSDAKYGGIAVADVSVTNTDDDTAGFTVTPTSGLTTTEGGGSANFTVRLNSEPMADVTVGVSSSDTSEGNVSPSSLTFTAADWSTPQGVTVTGVDDASLVDGNVAYSVITGAASSSDGKYAGLNPANVSVSNTDNDTPGIDLEGILNLSVSEDGTSVEFRVALTAQPLDDVVLSLTSSDAEEVAVSTSSITLDNFNWNDPVFVTLTGVDDGLPDGPQTATITIAVVDGSSDPLWSGVADRTFDVTNNDND